jgi:glucokinase
MTEIAIGIDIGGTFTKFGLVDREGNVIAENAIATYKHEQPQSFIKVLFTELEILLSSIGPHSLHGVGIGAPNANIYTGNIEQAPNLKWKGIVPFRELLKPYFGHLPIHITNDANAAAIGEHVFGAAKGKKHFLVVTLGTGLGSGFVVDGKLVYGYDGFAGELGHMTVVPNGRQCNCGKKGCLETYASAPGIRRTLMELSGSTLHESPLRELSFIKLSAKDITEQAGKGDPLALEAFEYTASVLGMGLANAVAVTSPSDIYLFGGLAKAGELLLAPTRRHFEANLLSIYKDKINLQLSGLEEKNAAVLGAASLVWSGLQANS